MPHLTTNLFMFGMIWLYYNTSESAYSVRDISVIVIVAIAYKDLMRYAILYIIQGSYESKSIEVTTTRNWMRNGWVRILFTNTIVIQSRLKSLTASIVM